MIALLQDMNDLILILVCDPLIYFAFGLAIFVLDLHNAWASAVFWGNSNYRRIVINPANQKRFWG